MRAIALGGAQTLEALARDAMLGVKGRHAARRGLHPREAIENLELGAGLGQALVLMLAMHFDEVVAQSLEERHRHRRVVDEGAMPTRTNHLAAYDDLTVVRAQPGLGQCRMLIQGG